MIHIPPDIQGLIFDCDGTIADTMPLHYQTWSAAIRQHGHDFPEALFYELAGIPTVQTVELLNQCHGYSLPVRETVETKERLFDEMVEQTLPIEPVVRLVREYAGKLPMAVATGGTRDICIKTLGALRLLQYFSAIVTADDVLHGKPAPDIFLEAARQLGLVPERCCAFEDGNLGLQAARAAGMMVIDVRPLIQSSSNPR